MKLNVLITLLFVGLVIELVLLSPGRHAHNATEWAGLLARLNKECAPENLEAEYYWSQKTQPTERKREQIIQHCRECGPQLLPHVMASLHREKDEQMRGMLTVIAAALGDAASLKAAEDVMLWHDHPAVRIAAARMLMRRQDPGSIRSFRWALEDDHFVLNGDCGLGREKFFPVRAIAEAALMRMTGRAETEEQVWQESLQDLLRESK